MITILFRRVSVCMGDDAGNGEYTIELHDSATLRELLHVILHGGSGNDWPIPYTGANSYWVIHSDIGELARIFTDSNGEWHITNCCCNENTLLKKLGITWTFAGRD
ncbi:hypothetical protein [Lachnoclostridium sp. Marseille-P6806]|uniref:hypothetical protein n=1 Tax=Lachnoclostridium sp. Marseille-P6806 TaxID=2364793 RepID=UPI0010317DE6|nr:hypothetical protein [Lachnoclostridium sp. Marseille-P6806]